MITTNEYAALSANVYNGSEIPQGYTLVAQRSNLESGFDAFAYQKITTDGSVGEIVIAIRGMQLNQANDVTAVAQMANDQVPTQYGDALAFYDSIALNNPNADISLTGHSLGGALASLVAAKRGEEATVFDAVPAQQLLDNPEIGIPLNADFSAVIKNYNAAFDPSTNYLSGGQIGSVQTVLVNSLPLIPDWFEREFINLIPQKQLRAMLELYFNLDQHGINSLVSALYITTQTFLNHRDPLTFDLDADGLETTALNTTNPILFDHDADGVKTATAWIAPDDGFLVLDRNGNGVIDNGRELFGDSTPLSGGGTAVDGFAALAQEDTNGDGQVNSSDTRWNQLRLWQDLNQDGISQTNELFTLTSKGIASINVTKTENNTLLPNGNVIADLGTYTKTDGTTATLGDTAQLGDVDLRENTFYSSFTDPVTLTPEAQALPNMHGSGQVRDLREAASLSSSFTTTLTQYTQASTRADQRNLLDSFIRAWSETSTMLTTATGAYAGHPLTVSFQGITNGTPEYNTWLDQLSIMERFNGRTFNVVPAGSDPVTIALDSGQMNYLNNGYNALKESAYNAIFLQTRGKAYLDAVALITDAAGKCSPQRRKGRKEKEVWAGEFKRAA